MYGGIFLIVAEWILIRDWLLISKVIISRLIEIKKGLRDMAKESRNRKDSLSSEEGTLQEDSLSGSPRNRTNNK